MIEKFNWERIEPMEIAQAKGKEKEHPVIRVARQYKSKEFMNHAFKQLAKEAQQMALLNKS